MKDRETKKLEAEELEKRVAPLAIVNQDSVDDPPPAGGDVPSGDGDTSSGGGGNPPIVDRTS